MIKQLKLFLLIEILFASIVARGQWTTISSGTPFNLKQIVFPDSLTGYILAKGISTNDELLKTIDGGMSWNNILNNHLMNHIDFINKDTGAVIAADTVFKTFNGGLNWNVFYTPPTATSKLFHMNTVDEWFLIVGQGSAFTTDGGVTWNNGSIFGTIPIASTDFQFVNDTTVIAVGWYPPKSLLSIDKGLHWTELGFFLPLGSGHIWSDCFINPITGFATGDHRILKSLDGGINWTKIDSTLGFDIYCLRKIDADNLYGVGYGGGIAKTSDGGNSWSIDNSGTANNLNKIIFINSHKAIAIGDNGTILMNTNIATGIANVVSNQKIVSVFPNPVSQTLTLQFQNQIPFAEINVLNVLGETILTQKINNSNIANLNVTSLASGIYFLQIKSNNKLFTQKFIKQ